MPFPSPPSPPRSPWQLLYGGAHALRRGWYRRRARALPRPVLSVGNLHWGGAGKTPITAALAAHLRDRGFRVAILSRGYGRRDHQIRVVSTFQQGPLLGPLVAGDEPVLLAGELPGVAVIVGPDRHAAGLIALHRLETPPDLFLLDDGFSHVALERDLDLLVFPTADPFAGGRLFPGGRLREPLASARWAQAALLTGTDASSTEASALGQALARFGFRGSTFAAPTRTLPARLEDGASLPLDARCFLVAAIARPETFRATCAAHGHEPIGELFFADHHPYPEPSLQRLRSEFGTSGADVVLTTSKDAVKLRGRLGLPLAELPIRAEPEPAFWTWLRDRLEEIGAEEASPR